MLVYALFAREQYWIELLDLLVYSVNMRHGNVCFCYICPAYKMQIVQRIVDGHWRGEFSQYVQCTECQLPDSGAF